ncbi:SGNH/GDSL hydrolase family protein [Nanoarchaeota archaeon]
MDKVGKNKYIFNVLFYGVIILILAALCYYNKSYWDNFFPRQGGITSHYLLLLYLGRTVCLVSILLMLVFKKKIYEKKKEVILFSIVLIFCLIILELFTSIYICNFSGYNLQSRVLMLGECGVESVYEPHHYLNYYGNPEYESPDGLNMHNSMGFRGPEIKIPKPEETYRIVAIGGSTTYTIEVKDWKKDFPRQLEKKLKEKYQYQNIEVINAGLGWWTSWESLVNLEFKILDLEPDLIIIYQGTNDWDARLVNPEKYNGDNSGYRKRWEESPFPLILRPKFVRLLTGISPSGLDRYVSAPGSIRVFEDQGIIEELNGTFLETLEENKPIYFERNLRNMIAIAKEHNVEVLLATFAYSKNKGEICGLPYFEQGISEQNEMIEQISKSHNISLYDFGSGMPNDEKYYVDCVHLNERGAELKGELFSDHIYSHKIIEKRIRELKKTLS